MTWVQKPSWRLVTGSNFNDLDCDGPTNMAVDEAILEAVGRGDSLPTLRLYSWTPPCLSLGYSQPIGDADLGRIEARGWQIVRRLTGGRAILHTDELTYSVALPLDHPIVAGTILDSYRRLSAALLVAVQNIGLNATADKRPRAAANAVGPVCFEIPSNYEITASGKKLIGSAQVRKHNAALQHGSLPLTGDLTRITEALVFPDEAARHDAAERITRRATTLSDALGYIVTWEQAADAICAAFEQTFAVHLDRESLTPVEAAHASELRETRYADAAWTSKR